MQYSPGLHSQIRFRRIITKTALRHDYQNNRYRPIHQASQKHMYPNHRGYKRECWWRSAETQKPSGEGFLWNLMSARILSAPVFRSKFQSTTGRCHIHGQGELMSCVTFAAPIILLFSPKSLMLISRCCAVTTVLLKLVGVKKPKRQVSPSSSMS